MDSNLNSDKTRSIKFSRWIIHRHMPARIVGYELVNVTTLMKTDTLKHISITIMPRHECATALNNKKIKNYQQLCGRILDHNQQTNRVNKCY